MDKIHSVFQDQIPDLLEKLADSKLVLIQAVTKSHLFDPVLLWKSRSSHANLLNIISAWENFKNVVLSSVHEEAVHIVNILSIILKQFIYKSRCQDIMPTYQFFKHIVTQLYLTELQVGHS